MCALSAHKDAAAVKKWRTVLAADLYCDSLACVHAALRELQYRASNSLFISDAASMAEATARTKALHSRFRTTTRAQLNNIVEESLRAEFQNSGLTARRHQPKDRVEIALAKPGYRRVMLAATPAVTASMPATTNVHRKPYILDCWTVYVPEISTADNGGRSISCYTMSPEARGAGLPDTAAGLMGSSPHDPTAATWMHAIGPFVF